MTIYSQIPLRDLQRLRVVVKNNHMKHYPKDKVTDKEADRIIESIEVVTKQNSDKRILKIVKDYDVDNVSKKILRIILETPK